MTGCITKRGKGTYFLRISLGRDEQTGKRLYRTATVHGTKKEAEQVLREMVSRFESGGVVSTDRVSLNAYLQEWLRVAKKNSVAERTFQIIVPTQSATCQSQSDRCLCPKLPSPMSKASMEAWQTKGWEPPPLSSFTLF